MRVFTATARTVAASMAASISPTRFWQGSNRILSRRRVDWQRQAAGRWVPAPRHAANRTGRRWIAAGWLLRAPSCVNNSTPSTQAGPAVGGSTPYVIKRAPHPSGGAAMACDGAQSRRAAARYLERQDDSNAKAEHVA